MTYQNFINLKSIQDIENVICELNQNPNTDFIFKSTELAKRQGAMHDASRLQLLVTYARKKQDSYLIFHKLTNQENALKDLCSYAPGIAGLRLCLGVKIGDKIIPRRVALRYASEKMKDTDDERLDRIINGRCVDIICVSGMNLQYLRPLFSARSKECVKNAIEMSVILKKVFDQINQSSSDKKSINDAFLQATSIFTTEIFQNTQEHATSNYKYEPYDAHVEGVIVSWSQLDEKLFSEDFKGNSKLLKYWAQELSPAKGGSTQALRCFQLSYFDSGPGLASRISNKHFSEMTRDEEKVYLIQCLKKNQTSKSQTGAGLGLPLVLESLQKIGGLIRIRSGRHCVFNCFSLEDRNDLYDFLDWTNETLEHVEGTVISIIIPLRRDN